MPKPKRAPWSTWEDMPIDEFRKRIAIAEEEATRFAAKMDDLFPGKVTLTKQQRKSAYRLLAGEHAMLTRVLDVVDRWPALFRSLADRDEGADPKALETALLRERIEKHLLFGRLDAKLGTLTGQLRDSAFHLAGKFKKAVGAAYQIAKMHAQTDKEVMDILAPVIDFRRKGAVAAARTRAANKTDPKE